MDEIGVEEVIQMVEARYLSKAKDTKEKPLTPFFRPPDDKVGERLSNELKNRGQIALKCFKHILNPMMPERHPHSEGDKDQLLAKISSIVKEEYAEIRDRVKEHLGEKKWNQLERWINRDFHQVQGNEIAETFKGELEQYLDVDLPAQLPKPSKADERMAGLKERCPGLNPVAESYIHEAYRTDETPGCFRATAVMVGCAAESLTLELSKELVNKMKSLPKTVPKVLEKPRSFISDVIDTLKQEFDDNKHQMHKLEKEYETYWLPFTECIRTVRNKAGHPNPVNSIKESEVKDSLSLFPSLAVLCNNLREWIKTSYNPP